MALARDQHRVAGLRVRDSHSDGGGPVGLDDDTAALVRRYFSGSGQHRGEDRERVLRTRVVRGEDGGVGESGARGTHWPAFLLVAIAAAAEDDVDAAFGHLA